LTAAPHGESTHAVGAHVAEGHGRELTELIEVLSEPRGNATPMIRRVLNTLPSTGNFVLNGTDRPFGDHSGAKEKVTPAIPPWTLHDLRRSFASGLQRIGVAPQIVELALNHRSGTFSGVAGIYQRHRYAKEVREAFELWSQHIETLISRKTTAA
jgi:hypothetical protein